MDLNTHHNSFSGLSNRKKKGQEDTGVETQSQIQRTWKQSRCQEAARVPNWINPGRAEPAVPQAHPTQPGEAHSSRIPAPSSPSKALDHLQPHSW